MDIPQMASLVDGAMVPSLQLGTPHMATIMILDDDHSGVFQFQVKFREISVNKTKSRPILGFSYSNPKLMVNVEAFHWNISSSKQKKISFFPLRLIGGLKGPIRFYNSAFGS